VYAKAIGFDQRLLPIIEEAVDQGAIQVFETLLSVGQIRPSSQDASLVSFLKNKLGVVDGTLLELALALREAYPQDELFVSFYEPSEPRASREAWALKLWADGPHLAVHTIEDAQRHPELLTEVNEFKLLRRCHRTFGAVGLIVPAGVAFYLLTHYNVSIDLRSKLWILGLLPILGFILYWYRSQFRLRYGLAEIGFGCMLAASTMLQRSDARLDSNLLFQLFASLYVIVRGFDNVEKGSTERPIGKFWKNITTPYQKMKARSPEASKSSARQR